MSTILHLLLNTPDEVVADLVTTLSGDKPANVICLYPDGISTHAVDWERLVNEIMAHDKTICWW